MGTTEQKTPQIFERTVYFVKDAGLTIVALGALHGFIKEPHNGEFAFPLVTIGGLIYAIGVALGHEPRIFPSVSNQAENQPR